MADVVHALDWLSENAKYKRAVWATELRQILAREKKQCTWCGLELKGARRSWCSYECRDAFRERCDPAFIRWSLEKRDKGVCAICKFDTLSLKQRLDKGYYRAMELRRYHSLSRFRRLREHFKCSAGVSPWEADHIVPVVEGGGCCGLDGYRTLCHSCHKSETAALAARRAEKRRPRPLFAQGAAPSEPTDGEALK